MIKDVEPLLKECAETLTELKAIGEMNGACYVQGFINSINKLPNVERPRGEWIYGEDESGQDGWFCSECKFFVPWYYQYFENDIDFIRDYKVCPHCLAEMVTYTGKERR